MQLRRDDEHGFVRDSASEADSLEVLEGNGSDEGMSKSKSDCFTKFGTRKMSLLDDKVSELDVYNTNSPGDSWLKDHLKNRRRSSKGTRVDKEGQLANEKENMTAESSVDKMTVESIKKKYGRPVKSPRVPGKGVYLEVCIINLIKVKFILNVDQVLLNLCCRQNLCLRG